jgi:AhpD family alkylhydroperoxidase
MSHARSEYRDFEALAPDAFEIVSALGRAAGKFGIDKQLLELIKLRASQINGCAFCVQHHILQSERLGLPADEAQPRRGLARGAAFFGAGARGVGLDRGADAVGPRGERRSLRAGAR